MTAIVTGHRGFIGGAVHARLIEEGEDFIAYDIKDTGNRLKVPRLLANFEVDRIYHIGAVAGVETCEQEKDTALVLNTFATEYWANVALLKNAHLVFISSAAASSMNPTWYGLTKRFAEQILLYYQAKYGLKVTILRLPNVFGPESKYKNSVIARMCKDALFNKGVYVHGDGKQTRHFISLEDVVELILKTEKEGLYSLEGYLATIKHIGEEIGRKMEVPVFHTKQRNDYGAVLKDNIICMPYYHKKSFNEALDETIEYFKRIKSSWMKTSLINTKT